MPLIPLNKVTLAQAKDFADAHGLDYSDITETGLAGLAKLRARINAAGYAGEGGIEVAETKHVITGNTFNDAAQGHIAIATSDGEEVLPNDAFEKICDAIFKTSAQKVGDVYIPAKLAIPTDRKEAMRLAIAHRDATRLDPRNPFPGKAVGDYIRLMIPIQDPKHHSGGDLPVFVNVNETAYEIKRGEVVTLRYEIAVAVHNAQADAMRMNENGTTEVTGKIQQFPYTLVA
jgi:hypothetical protein